MFCGRSHSSHLGINCACVECNRLGSIGQNVDNDNIERNEALKVAIEQDSIY